MSDTIHANIIPAGSIGANVKVILRGLPGEDGVSPTVTIEDIENGHRIIITDAEGEHSIDVPNGADGKNWIPTDAELNDIADKASAKIQPSITKLSEDVNGKQDAISDLDDIRNGASKGATALQNIPAATQSTMGGFKTSSWGGIGVYSDSGVGYIQSASEQQIRDRKKFTVYFAITPTNIDFAVKAVMTDGSSAWTDAEKAAALSRLGIVVDDNGICHFG